MSLTQVIDAQVYDQFAGYVQQLTEDRSALFRSGIAVTDPSLNEFLSGTGLTHQMPSWRDLGNEDANTSTDAEPDVQAMAAGGGAPNPRNDATPLKTSSDQEIAVRVNRNQHWQSADLTADLAGDDPMDSIASRVADYWVRERERTFIAIVQGIIGSNTANNGGDYGFTDLETLNGGAFQAGVTDFSASAVIDALLTISDRWGDITTICMHPVVRAKMQKNNLISFIPDARGEVMIPTFQGMEVVESRNMPNTGGVYDTWMFGQGQVRMGDVAPKNPVATSRVELAANGGGTDVLHSRSQYSIHFRGHRYVGTTSLGGPTNGTGANQFANAGSWERAVAEREMVKFVRLTSREA